MIPLLLACYELGHQPLSLASPLAFLRAAGFAAEGVDLAVSSFPTKQVAAADFIGIAVPMHTALRLGVAAAAEVRRLNPNAHICFFGLYAWLNADFLLNAAAAAPGIGVIGDEYEAPLTAGDSVIGGEYEAPLTALVSALARGDEPTAVPGISTGSSRRAPSLTRLAFPVPDRSDLPPLQAYAHYMTDGESRRAGYTEASRGCLHTCRHCPVVPVYQGRFFVIPAKTVLADIRQQVAAGAQHITFGDPDFLNGPGHALTIARALHAEFPTLTFDFTTKVEHILKHRDKLPELHQLGAAFVISAFEATSEHILTRLNKGHTVADMELALSLLRDAGLSVQPTWMPFTPWTTVDDFLGLLTWIWDHDLVPHVPLVQLSVRMLVPPQSALLDHADAYEWLGPLAATDFGYCWAHRDPRLDRLQATVAALAEQAPADPYAAFTHLAEHAFALANRPVPAWSRPHELSPPPPRLTEDWFC